jgi:uncharacterized protein YbjT (DUF2867 family)
VVGATGAQGGGLARAILAEPDGEFAVRALTRDPSSPKAKKLADAGAEVVAADLDDQAALRAAFDAVHGVYLVTNYWADQSAEHEIAQAANGARAAKAAGVQHLIWSTLEDTRAYLPLNDPGIPVFDGRYTVPHFDAKSEADKFFAEAGVPTTYLRPCMYWEAFDDYGPRRTALRGDRRRPRRSSCAASKPGECLVCVPRPGRPSMASGDSDDGDRDAGPVAAC